MFELIQKVEAKYRKPRVVNVRTGDTVRVHQKIKEAGKERVQIFEGLVIRTDRKGSLTSRITVRRLSSGVWVEKSFLLHSPLVLQVEVTKRSKVRRKYLTYMRGLTGKSTRLQAVDFNKARVNRANKAAEEEEAAVKEEAVAAHVPAKKEKKAK